MSILGNSKSASLKSRSSHTSLNSAKRDFYHHINEATLQKKENADGNQKKIFFLPFKKHEPIDYESYIAKQKTILANDPHRELVLIPSDDVLGNPLEKADIFEGNPLPSGALSKPISQLTRQCILFYDSISYEVKYRFSDYGVAYNHLSNFDEVYNKELSSPIYEVDLAIENSANDLHMISVIQQGSVGLAEPSETGKKEFVKCFAELRRNKSGCLNLRTFRDDRKSETLSLKYDIPFSFIVSVDYEMQESVKMFYVRVEVGDCILFYLNAASEDAVKRWEQVLNQHSHSTKVEEVVVNGDGDSNKQTVDSMLHRLSTETETAVCSARARAHQPVLQLFPDMHNARKPSKRPVVPSDDSDVSPFQLRHEFAQRFLLDCLKFETLLQPGDNLPENPEPFFIIFYLVDLSHPARISEQFFWDPNSAQIQQMISPEPFRVHDAHNSKHPDGVDQRNLPFDKIKNCNQCLFTLSRPVTSDIYLCCRVEKILQGSSGVDKYITKSDGKTGSSIQKSMRSFCSHIGNYRQPFGWTYVPLLDSSGQLNSVPNSLTLYKHENHKFSEADLFKNIKELQSRPDKQTTKHTVIPTKKFLIKLRKVDANEKIPNLLSPSLFPYTPQDPAKNSVTMEIEEFLVRDQDTGLYAVPELVFKNNFYVYPKSLNYEKCQGVFGRARNLSIFVELRDSDDEFTPALKAMYAHNRPDGSVFSSWVNTVVNYHDEVPDFSEEMKVCLPLVLSPRLHLFFRIMHVSCDAAGKLEKKNDRVAKESKVGYAWLRLTDPMLVSGEFALPVSVNIPTGYLDKGVVPNSEIQWVDSGKPIFRVVLRLASSVFTAEPNVQRFFQLSERIMPSSALQDAAVFTRSNSVTGSNGTTQYLDTKEVKTAIESLSQLPRNILVRFMAPIFNQLFAIVTSSAQGPFKLAVMNAMVHILGTSADSNDLHERIAGSEVSSQSAKSPRFPLVERTLNLFKSYIKYCLSTELITGAPVTTNSVTLHEELTKVIYDYLRPGNSDSLSIRRFLSNAWFFFSVIVKSMAEQLCVTGRYKLMSRTERFPEKFRYLVQQLVAMVSCHVSENSGREADNTSMTLTEEGACTRANEAMAFFLRRLLNMMDRGFVFQLINLYSEKVTRAELRLDFLRLLSQHEHFVPLSLPIVKHRLIREMRAEFCLSAEFCKQHFLVGCVLSYVQSALCMDYTVRKAAVRAVRDLLCKHSLDKRLVSAAHRSRVAALYIPLMSFLVDQKHRLTPPPKPMHQQPAAPVRRPPSEASLLDNNRQTVSLRETVQQQHRASVASTASSQVDPDVLNKIAGFESTLNKPGPVRERRKANMSVSSRNSRDSLTMSSASAFSVHSGDSDITIIDEEVEIGGLDGSIKGSETVSLATRGGGSLAMMDPFREKEKSDLLICLMHIVSNLEDDVITSWFGALSPNDRIDFLEILEITIVHFRYDGVSKTTTFESISSSLVANRDRKGLKNLRASKHHDELDDGINGVSKQKEVAAKMARWKLEANLSTEIGLIVLDVLSIYMNHFQKELLSDTSESPAFRRIINVYLELFSLYQSETLLTHVFASLRIFVSRFATVLFSSKSPSTSCRQLCVQLLSCSESRLESVRRHSASLLFLLLKVNHSVCSNVSRIHLQTMVALSAKAEEISTDQDRLSRFGNFLKVVSDLSLSRVALGAVATGLSSLCSKMQDVLTITAAFQMHKDNPEMCIDLHWQLATSYKNTPSLRLSYLQNMGDKQLELKNYTEAAFCTLHRAALVAEILKMRGEHAEGYEAFAHLSPNIAIEESHACTEPVEEEEIYTHEKLTQLTEEAADLLMRAERYELVHPCLKLTISFFESCKDYAKLAEVFQMCAKACNSVISTRGKRFLGSFYRVGLYGNLFEESERQQFIYKEPGLTRLSELSERLKDIYGKRFGPANVIMLSDSGDVDVNTLQHGKAYVQITYVTPESHDDHPTNTFVLETPFTSSGSTRHGTVEEQWRRRTRLTTASFFPALVKRLPVLKSVYEDLSPLAVAVIELTTMTEKILYAAESTPPDMKRLQMVLQGCLATQVNAGPLAYAEAFLSPDRKAYYASDRKLAELERQFSELLRVCKLGLRVNKHLIKSDQLEYHNSLAQGYDNLKAKLAENLTESMPDSLSLSSHTTSVSFV